MLTTILSHKWGKLNLPTLLFKVGLLTLINMDSLIYLDRYHLSMDSLKYLDRCHLSRYIKESIFIKVKVINLNKYGFLDIPR